MAKHQNGRATHDASLAPQRARPAEAQPVRGASVQHLAPGAIVQRALAAPQTLRPADLIALQRTIGNQAVNALLGSIGVQAKLIVNAPGDRYEREADRVAEQVLRMPAASREETSATLDPPQVMTKSAPGSGGFAASGEFARQLDASRGQGRALPPVLRESFESRFGADFGAVRLHSGDQAGQLNRPSRPRRSPGGRMFSWRRRARARQHGRPAAARPRVDPRHPTRSGTTQIRSSAPDREHLSRGRDPAEDREG